MCWISLFFSPGISGSLPQFATTDVVPFRLTPNMQNFLGPIFTEGILTSGIMAIGRSLTEPEVGRKSGSETGTLTKKTLVRPRTATLPS